MVLFGGTMCVIMLATVLRKCKKTKICRKRQFWNKTWLQRREQGRGLLHMLNTELLPEDPTSYRNFLRLNNKLFEYLLTLVESDIAKQDTFMRQYIPSKSKLETILRFLATGETFRSLMYGTRIAESTISRFIPVVCKAIIKKLKPKYLKTPITTKEWEKISDEFTLLWQFPNCIGALDGRHIIFRPPISQGSFYYNNKGTHSIVLLGLADAKY